MKKIWIFNHYATKPDEPATRDFDIAKELAKRGHKITIFASAFSHYKQKIKYLEPGEKFRIEETEGFRFVWIRTYLYKKNNWKRMINMLSYSWQVFFIGIQKKERPDVIVGTCVHPFAVLSAYLVSKNKKCRFFFMVTDLWPQTLVDIGYLSKNNPLVWIMRKLEKFLYNKAEKIIILHPYMGDYIKNLGVVESDKKVFWIPNGVDISRYEGIKKYEGGNPDNFVFMYTGIHAKYANLEIILKAAKILENKGRKNIKFILVGDGLEKKNLMNMAKEMNILNVEFRDMVPKSELYKTMSEADCFILIIKYLPVLAKYGMSSNKTNDYMISGRPIVFSVSSKNNPIEKAGAGITVAPNDPQALADACERMISLSSEERIKMGKRGVEYIKKYHDIRLLAEKFEKLM